MQSPGPDHQDTLRAQVDGRRHRSTLRVRSYCFVEIVRTAGQHGRVDGAGRCSGDDRERVGLCTRSAFDPDVGDCLEHADLVGGPGAATGEQQAGRGRRRRWVGHCGIMDWAAIVPLRPMPAELDCMAMALCRATLPIGVAGWFARLSPLRSNISGVFE